MLFRSLPSQPDYHSPGWLGSFSSSIYWTDIIIKCTNIMHWVLAQINRVIPNYGLCILCLTIMVRGLMFPISRKQAIMAKKMQDLQPLLKELQDGPSQAVCLGQLSLGSVQRGPGGVEGSVAEVVFGREALVEIPRFPAMVQGSVHVALGLVEQGDVKQQVAVRSVGR